MQVSRLALLIELIDKAHQLGNDQITGSVLEVLLHAAERDAAALSRVERQLQRLSATPFRLGMAHLEDASSPDRDPDESRQLLAKARESFKEAAFASPTGPQRADAALLCAVTSLVLGYPDDARRWAHHASTEGDTAVDDVLGSVPPPPTPPPPPSNWLFGLNRWWHNLVDGPSLTEAQQQELNAWHAEREATLTEAVAVLHAARLFTNAVDPQAPPNPDVRLLWTGRRWPGLYLIPNVWVWVLDEYQDALPIGTTRLRTDSGTFRRHWPGTEYGTVEVRLRAVEDGRLRLAELQFGDPPPTDSEASSWELAKPRLAETNVEWRDGNQRWRSSYSPGGLEDHNASTTVSANQNITVLYDAMLSWFGDRLHTAAGAPAAIATCREMADDGARVAVLPFNITLGPPREGSAPPAELVPPEPEPPEISYDEDRAQDRSVEGWI